ncbi:MAG: hypothetical protein JWP91_827 [Fibrobacteres bacterium]|nr:hypothetical protein [Fibrobacterota bacterium]
MGTLLGIWKRVPGLILVAGTAGISSGIGFDGSRNGFIISPAIGIHHTYFLADGLVDQSNVRSENKKNGLTWDLEAGYSLSRASFLLCYDKVRISGSSLFGNLGENGRYGDGTYAFDFLGIGSDLYLSGMFPAELPLIYAKARIGFMKVDEGYNSLVGTGLTLGAGIEAFSHVSIEALDGFIPISPSNREIEYNSFQLLIRLSLF